MSLVNISSCCLGRFYAVVLAFVLVVAAMSGLTWREGGAYPLRAEAPAPRITHIMYDVSEFFINPLGDVPLMQGLDVDYDSLLVFDKAEGRFVEIAAIPTESMSQQDVGRFYADSMPMLGWRAMGYNEFRRAGEHLKINIDQGDKGWIVRFVMSPVKK